MLINAGIVKIFGGESYPDEFALSLLGEAGIAVVTLS